ncbi:MAG TPA: F0F1 ATP synthase subunit B [bacterium]|nr:F0F1 ATP synthase subunit B [bacterium]HPG82658.1 F0F1 ATP synthase subunit B [bacterium]HPM58576.1 F0F1 ATP synthase subunit B [bacterium]
MELMTPAGGTIFWTTLTFLLLLFALTKVGWKPILNMLDEREKKLKESLELAEQAKIASQKTLAEQNELLETARREAQEILARNRKAAEATKEEIIKKASSEAEQLIAKARREIDLSRDKAIEEIRDLAVELSMDATAKLVGKSLDAGDHQSLIDESLKKLGDLN